jgi:Flp pilus assembly pilin Flp
MNYDSIGKFAGGEDAQDLIEYTLLLGFVALICVTVFMVAGGATQSIWAVSNTHIAAANRKAAGTDVAGAAAPASPPASPGTGTGGGGHRDNHDGSRGDHWH